MKQIFNNSKLSLKYTGLFMTLLLSFFLFTSCSKDTIEIQDNFSFEMKVMPVPENVVNGQTVEIRIIIQPRGNYSDTKFYIRYFQFEGLGELRYNNDPAYLPNDLYHLPDEQFRLYYTSLSSISQSFEIWISDNFGNEKQLSFHFNSSN